MPKKHLRSGYFGKKGFVRGTVVKPKYFKEKLVVDKDFDTISTSDKKTGELTGRENIKKGYERTAVIRMPSGELAGRTKQLSIPYPKSYPISTRQKGRIKTKRIPVLHLEHFD